MSTIAAGPQAREHDAADLLRRFNTIRARTRELARPLPAEDQVVQTALFVSPTRWHLAHTTWFFETFILRRFSVDYELFHEHFGFLFNSYYQGAGEQFDRARRGQLGRPRVSTILDYRSHVDDAVRRLLQETILSQEAMSILEVGLHHEQQHQELILTDIKHVLAFNPLRPVYHSRCAQLSPADSGDSKPVNWLSFEGGVFEIGHDGEGFCFDNERSRHKVFVDPFELASRPVSCAEFLRFLDEGGYDEPKWWLSEGWDCIQREEWRSPLYWKKSEDTWWTMTLGGFRPVDPHETITHLSYFEADAYARWAGARLPTEAQWEIASEHTPIDGNFADTERFHPRRPTSPTSASAPQQLFGDVWEWTSSQYRAYPGFEPWNGVLGEYNGKFMCNQFVLRGGSCATASDHIRRTYRNFFPPDARWQFSGLRLAR